MNYTIDHNSEFFDPDSFREDEFLAWINTQPDFIKFYGHPAALKHLQARLSHYKNGRAKISTVRENNNVLTVIKTVI